MSRPLLLCVLPAERAHLTGVVLGAGATPVIDLTASEADGVPEGAWTRAEPGEAIPGSGPVILVGEGAPVPGRPTWLERARPGPAPSGFAGIVLRGLEAPGQGGDRPGLDLLAEVPPGTPVLLEAGLSPTEAARAVALGAAGVLLSDVLLALPELALPPRLAALLDEAGPSGGRRVAGFRALCPPSAPALRRLAEGASPLALTRGWFAADDPAERPWPAGAGLAIARGLAARHGGLVGLIAAYTAAIQAGTQERLAPLVEAVLPSLRGLVSAIAEQLAEARPSPAPEPAVLAAPAPARPAVVCGGLAVGLPGGAALFADENLEALGRGEPRLARVARAPERPTHLARPGRLDLGADYGLSAPAALDAAGRMMLAAGLEALADAGLPLVLDPSLPGGRGMPAPLRAGTAVIVASALGAAGPAPEVLLARLIGAAGPAVGLRAGRASASTALALAADWIALGRAERVLVVAADDPTALAPTIEALAEVEALGAGAAGFLLEREDLASARGRGARARLARVEHGERALEAVGEQGVGGALLETTRGVNMVSSIPYFGDSLGAGLDDALAIDALTRGLGVDPVFRASRVARDDGGAPILLVWERAAPATPDRAEPWLVATTGLRTPSLARQGRVLLATREPLPTPTPAPPPAPEPSPAPLAAPEPQTPSEPEPSPEAETTQDRPAPALDGPDNEPTAELPLLELETAESEPVTRAIEPAEETMVAVAARASAPPAPAAPLPRVGEEDEDALVGRAAGGRLAAWSRRLRRKTRKSPAELAKSGDWMALARERVLAELLILLAQQDEEATSPPAESRLGADLGVDLEAQGELVGRLCQELGIELDVDELLTDDPPIERLAGRIVEEARAVWQESPEVPAGLRRLFAVEVVEPEPTTTAPAAVVPVAVAPMAPSPSPAPLLAGGAELVAELVAAEAGYRPHELRPDLELEGDLGLDAAARARIVGALCARYGAPPPELEEPITLATLTRWTATLPLPAAAPPRVAPPPGAAEPRPAPDAPPAEPEPAAVERAPLPGSFRVRRLVRVPQPLSALGSVRGRVVQVLGHGPLAEALRRELAVRGARSEGSPDAVLDLSDDPATTYALATRLTGAPPRDWIALTRLGEGEIEPWLAARAGARAGIAKALRREWPGCRARVVDLDPALEETESVLLALDELSAGDDALEVWRSSGARRVLALRSDGLPPPAAWPGTRPTVLIAGGTRGIGYHIALALARRTRARLVLLARTAPGKRPYDEATARASVERALRARGRRPSEARILRGLEPFRMADEARLAVGRLEAAGAEVHVIRADLGDPVAVESAVGELRARYQPLDGVVIALPAGERHALAGRDPTALNAALAPRFVGAAALAAARPPEAWLLSVGGLAGRFGQAGRVEIAAAGQAMANLCAVSPRALHVTCPAWQGGGRADEAPGADPLPVDAGVDLLLDLIAGGATGERVISGRLGPGVLCACHPLVETLDVDGDRAETTHPLRPRDEPWLVDCSLGGTPILPESVAVELMVATALAAAPGTPCAGLVGLRVHGPLAVPLDAEARLVTIAEVEGPGRVRAVVHVERPGVPGRTRHAEAVILLGEAPPASVLPPAFFPEESIPRSQIYRRLHHGSTFQVLGDAGAVAREGLLADAVVEHGGLGSDLLSAPLVLEAATQAAALHRMVIEGTRCLPSSVDGVWLLRDPPDGEPLELMVQRVGEAYDVDVHGPEGAVLRVRGLRLAPIGALSEAERFPEPEGGWPSAAVGLASS